jgi:hypothetical protein
VSVSACHREGTVLGDDTGQPHWLCGAWRTASLRRLLAASPDVEGMALRRLFGDAAYDIISVDGRPSFDSDTPPAQHSGLRAGRRNTTAEAATRRQ